MTDAIPYQHCGACGHVQGFHRPFCAGCGAASPETKASAGRGAVRAVTTLHRAPTPEWQAEVPYTIALIDLDEGFTLMAQIDAAARIGDRVRALPAGEPPLTRFTTETPA